MHSTSASRLSGPNQFALTTQTDDVALVYSKVVEPDCYEFGSSPRPTARQAVSIKAAPSQKVDASMPQTDALSDLLVIEPLESVISSQKALRVQEANLRRRYALQIRK